MLIKSSGSVKIISLDVEGIIKNLKNSARKLLQERKDVIEVFIFGSLAKGNAVPGSDADILIVLKSSDKRIIDRIPEFMDFFTDAGIDVDIFPYTQEEMERLSKENPAIREMLSFKVKIG